MCNLKKHSGQGCVIQGIVDLYEEAKYPQNAIIKITRKMRDEGASDEEIIRVLELKNKKRFRMDRKYLKQLVGFVTSRNSPQNNDMYSRWLSYHKRQNVVLRRI